MGKKRIVYYTNQFFGQVGGEEMADQPPMIKAEPLGPGTEVNKRMDNAQVVASIICGDNYYSEHRDEARTEIIEKLTQLKPDLVIAGPAFNAGRLGMACGDVCALASETLKISTITGMYEENPAVNLYRHQTIMVKTGKSAASMKKALDVMIEIANQLLAGISEDAVMQHPELAGVLFSKGIRVNVFKEKTGAERALDMLLAKLKGEPYETEIPLPTYDRVDAAPGVKNLSKAVVALVTSGGIVPEHNPDRLPAATAKHYCVYDISGIEALVSGEYESVHAGYDPVAANINPNRIVPIDLMRQLEQEGRIGKLYDKFFSTTGNSTSVADATRMGREIAEELEKNRVDAVIMTST